MDTHNPIFLQPSPPPGKRLTLIRRPAVAGYFYPADAVALAAAVDAYSQRREVLGRAIAAVVPHGSFQHAGAVLGATFAQVRIPRRCILLGSSHTGRRMAWSLMDGGAYRTPLGEVPIETSCAQALRLRCPFLTVDPEGQRGEHAIEVLLPFLQRLGPQDLTLVPLITTSTDAGECRQLAQALAQVVRMQEEPVLLIASADLSHYLPQEQGIVQDRALIEAICALDGQRLLTGLAAHQLTMCGETAVACVLEAAAQLGATQGRLMRYATSAAAGGDPHSTTGYAGIVIT